MTSAADYFPKRKTLTAFKKAALKCHGCPLYKKATQTVFGEGSYKAKLIVVGEIPGNKEDLTGKPFQGPAGTLLHQSLEKINLKLDDVYFTNVVKHFKFSLINNKRMHRSPVTSEINACLPWLKAEVEIIQPKIILCLGATAAKSIIDKKFQLLKNRGKWFTAFENIQILVTYHPSAILRAGSHEARHQMKIIFINDLKKIAKVLKR
ncbi:MAG TPA: UdgX family uracil-DNA binding protein [Gammaproteobacteria bacterium]|jgi:DNA polymerase|nr:UdgX family uracil-DNA binding protein [Gammaproteobacteria bacterium]